MPFAFYIIFAQIAVGWWFIQYLLSHERGPKEPRRALIIAGLFGVVAIALALVLEIFLVSPNLSNSSTGTLPHLSLLAIFLNCLLVGVIEESAKALPLTAFIYKKKYFDEITDGIIYYGIAGMVFGVLESISYTLRFGLGAGIAKIIVGPFSHAAFSALIGYFIVRHKLLKKPAWTITFGFIGAISLHGLYDFGLFSGRGWGLLSSLVIAIAANVSVFVLFTRAKRTDERLGISTVGHNLYCRNCGYPNRYHYVYCINCGKKT